MTEGLPEPGWTACWAEAVRLARRARRHMPLVGALAILAAVGALGAAARRPLRTRATVVLRLTETGGGGLGRIGGGDRALRGYVTEVAFTSARLRALAARLGTPIGGSAAAVASLRARITVEVVQNHALALIPPAERPRSAHVRISYDDVDPGRARAMARELGNLLAATGR